MTWVNDTGAPVCVNADRSAVVDCGSAEAAFVLVGPGGELPDGVAKQYGLDEQRGKAAEKAEDKAEAPAADKGVDPPAGRAAPRR